MWANKEALQPYITYDVFIIIIIDLKYVKFSKINSYNCPISTQIHISTTDTFYDSSIIFFCTVFQFHAQWILIKKEKSFHLKIRAKYADGKMENLLLFLIHYISNGMIHFCMIQFVMFDNFANQFNRFITNCAIKKIVGKCNWSCCPSNSLVKSNSTGCVHFPFVCLFQWRKFIQ